MGNRRDAGVTATETEVLAADKAAGIAVTAISCDAADSRVFELHCLMKYDTRLVLAESPLDKLIRTYIYMQTTPFVQPVMQTALFVQPVMQAVPFVQPVMQTAQ